MQPIACPIRASGLGPSGRCTYTTVDEVGVDAGTSNRRQAYEGSYCSGVAGLRLHRTEFGGYVAPKFECRGQSQAKSPGLGRRRAGRRCRQELFGKIEADDWRSVNLDGSVSTKQDDLSGLKSGKVKHIPLEMGPSDVKMLSDTIAVVQSTATDRRTMGGAGPATTYAFTDVFVKGADLGWRVVRSQATKLK